MSKDMLGPVQLKKSTVTSTPLNGNILKILEYKYDPAGRRILRQVTDSINPQKSNIKKYYYDGDNILAELDAENNLTASYTHSPLGADDVLGAKFTSAAVNNGLASSTGHVYYLKDHLNTINEITNANGDIVQKMDYSAYGVLRSVKDSAGVEVGFENAPVRSSFTYTGREFEPELNMYYYRARYYDPNTGRFLQQDIDPGKLDVPITFINKYSYAGNNPVMFADPSGLSWLSDVFDSVVNAGHDFIATLGAGLDNLLKNKTFQIICVIIAAALIGPAVAGLLGASGWTAVAISAGVGGLVGGLSYVGLGLGTFAEGFALGALAGGLAGYQGGLYGNNNPVLNFLAEERALIQNYGWSDYLFKADFLKKGFIYDTILGGGFVGRSFIGFLGYALINGAVPKQPKRQDEQ